eukprot:scaffold8531_cov130-Isochrysis_galbana.AAC.1
MTEGGLARGGRADSRALRLGEGEEGAILSSCSNIAQVRLDLSLSCSGQVPARFANALRGRKRASPVAPPSKARSAFKREVKLC